MIVNTTDEATSFRGVVWQSRGPWITLRDVEFLRSGHAPVKMDGDVILERTKISFLQVTG